MRNAEFHQRRAKINRRILIIIAIIFSVLVSSYFSVSLHYILSSDFESLLRINAMAIINTMITEKRVLAIFFILELIVISFLILFTNGTKNIYHSEKIKLTDKLEVPIPVRRSDNMVHLGGWQKKIMTKFLNLIL